MAKKIDIELSFDSYAKLLNECYNDSHDTLQRTRGTFLNNKSAIKDNADRHALGRQQNDLLKVMNDVTKVKLEVARLVKEGLDKMSSDEEGPGKGLNLEMIKSLNEIIKGSK